MVNNSRLTLLITMFASLVSITRVTCKLVINPEKEIVFGQSLDSIGTFRLYGTTIKNGINAYFNRINKQGGVNSRTLRLISLEDNGNPITTEKNIDSLQEAGVSMFLGIMGTKIILKLLPKIRNKEIAVFFPWGGQAEFQNPGLTHIINGPGYLKPQLEEIADHLLNTTKISKFALFYADDSFSSSAASYLSSYLEEHGMRPIISHSYNRLTLDTKKAALDLIKHDPKAVICISTTTPASRLINTFFEKGHYDTTFYGIDSTMFIPTIHRDMGIQFFYSSSVPDPVASTLPLAQEYRQDMAEYFPYETPNILSFAYYLSAAIIVDALQSITGEITMEKIIEKIEQMKKRSIKGFPITFNPSNRHAFGTTSSILKGT